MAVCELCGCEATKLKLTKVAGTQMSVCNKCGQHGQSVENTYSRAHTFKRKVKEEEKALDVKEKAPSLINSALGKKGLTVHHMARALNIKESSLLKYTTGKLKLDVETARKIERFLEISLVEEVESISTDDYLSEDESSSQSLGDLLKKSIK